MHRVRQSLGYYEEFGWKPTVVAVHPDYVEGAQDPLLEQTLPPGLRVIRVKAFSTKYTRKVGLGSLALRSLYFYWRAVNRLLKRERFDLVFFSTTQFPVMILGAYWKRRFGIPYVIDMQDPWHTDYYLSKPKSERPPKYWFAYRLNKWLEPIAMRRVDAIVAVTSAYCDTLRERYPHITERQCHEIPFGVSPKDYEVAKSHAEEPPYFQAAKERLRIVYTGVVNTAMLITIRAILTAFRNGLPENALWRKVHFFFVGTNYAPEGMQKQMVAPIASELGISAHVTEITGRIGYFEALKIQQSTDLLLLPGTQDEAYTPSKVYNYVASRKPIFTVFHQSSNVNAILHSLGRPVQVNFSSGESADSLADRILPALVQEIARLPFTPDTDWEAFQPYTARERARRQVEVFEEVKR